MEQYFAQTFIVSGVLLIIAAVFLHRTTNLAFVFLGSSFILTGSIIALEMMAENWVNASLLGITLTTVLFSVFWKPLKRLQQKTKDTHIDVELHKKQFVLDADVNIVSEWEYSHSGISWKVRSVEPLLKGALVRIERIEDGVLWVSAIK